MYLSIQDIVHCSDLIIKKKLIGSNNNQFLSMFIIISLDKNVVPNFIENIWTLINFSLIHTKYKNVSILLYIYQKRM